MSDGPAYRLDAAGHQALRTGITDLLRQQVVLQQRLREQEQAATAASESLYLDLLDVLDALDALQDGLGRHEAPSEALWKRLPRNLGSIRRKLADALERRDVAAIALGDGDDFSRMRVLETRTAGPGDAIGRQVLREGYRMGDKVLRPAEVVLTVSGD